MTDALDKLLRKRKFISTTALERAGFSGRQIAALVQCGRLVRTTFGAEGEIHGLYEHPDAANDADHDEAVATILTGGIICGQYAAMKHGIATCLPDDMSFLVGHDTVLKPRAGIHLIRTRRKPPLTVGIEDVRNDLGVKMRITSKARTVVDLLRAKGRNGDDYEHGLASLVHYLENGGTPSELMEIAEKVASRTEGGLKDLIETTCNAHQHTRSFMQGH